MTSNDSGVDVDTSNDSNDGSFLVRYQPPQPIPLTANAPIEFNLFARPQAYDAGEKMGGLPSNGHSMKMYRAKSRLKSAYPNILAGSNDRKMHLAVSLCNTELLTRILDAGTSPNSPDEHQRTPLHLASCRGYSDVVRLLLRYGANPNVVDSLGNTPLHLAVISASTNNYNVVVKLLLLSGASVHILDRTGKNPLELASGKLRLVHNRHHNLSAETCGILEDIRTMINLKINLNYYNKPPRSPALAALEQRLKNMSTDDQQMSNDDDGLLNSVQNLSINQ